MAIDLLRWELNYLFATLRIIPAARVDTHSIPTLSMAAVGIISMPASPHELANSAAGAAACLAAAAAVSDGIAAVAAATTTAAAQCSAQFAACPPAASPAISIHSSVAVCSVPAACNPAVPVHVFSHIVAPALATSQTAAPVLATSHTAAPVLATGHIAAPHRHHHAQRLAKHDCAHGPIARLPPRLESLGIDAQLAAVQVAGAIMASCLL